MCFPTSKILNNKQSRAFGQVVKTLTFGPVVIIKIGHHSTLSIISLYYDWVPPSPVLNRAVIDLHGPIVCSRPNEDLAQRERSRVRIAVSKLCFVFLLLLRGRQ
jgi:hypothetical protein